MLTRKDKYNARGVYELKCMTCEQVYIGQTGRDIKTRYKEHVSDIKSKKDKSRYALHI
jgi:predicted GIY-YIG superfamily endonuclease